MPALPPRSPARTWPAGPHREHNPPGEKVRRHSLRTELRCAVSACHDGMDAHELTKGVKISLKSLPWPRPSLPDTITM